ncbi:hypothetical protein MMC15_000995 [Xylographa vitiligo]|nr:hypothetical protein [Xylographa vitiligo]
MVAHLDAHAAALGLDRGATTFVDLGAGNGELLFALRREGWRGGMVGVDYAGEAVELARRVGAAGGWGDVRFEVWDLMGGTGEEEEEEEEEEEGWVPEGGVGVVLDKGTFDAVALSAGGEAERRGVCGRYVRMVRRLVRMGGVVLLTSCNWTEGELAGWFGEGWEVVGRIGYPTFRFGGRTGQSVSSVCFRRVR